MIFRNCSKSDLALVNQKNPYDGNNEIVHTNNANNNQIPTIINDQKTCCSESKRQPTFKSTMILWRCFFIIILLAIIGYGVSIVFSIRNIDSGIQRLNASINLLNGKIRELERMNNECMKTIQRWQPRMKQVQEESNSHSFSI